jgi:hypothetical protein
LPVVWVWLVFAAGFAVPVLGLAAARLIPALRRPLVWRLAAVRADVRLIENQVSIAVRPAVMPTSWPARFAYRLLGGRREHWRSTIIGALFDTMSFPDSSAPRQGAELVADPPRPDLPARWLDDNDLLLSGAIMVPAETQGVDWEGGLARAIGHRGAWRLVWCRTVSAGYATHAHTGADWLSGAIDVRAPKGYLELVRDGYGSRVGRSSLIITGVEAVEGSSRPRVRHCVGTPVSTLHGTMLRLSQRVRLEKGPTEVLVAPEDLDPAHAGFVVLQGIPYDGELQHNTSDAALFRQLASYTMVAGARAVLVLPALPHPLTLTAVRCVAELADRSTPPPGQDFARAARDVKRLIVRYGDDTRQPKARLIAQQVLVFLAEREVRR